MTTKPRPSRAAKTVKRAKWHRPGDRWQWDCGYRRYSSREKPIYLGEGEWTIWGSQVTCPKPRKTRITWAKAGASLRRIV